MTFPACASPVYKVGELVGTSPESWEKAAVAGVGQASKGLRSLRGAGAGDGGRALLSALEARVVSVGESVSHQVSTSAALVAGPYSGAVTAATILQHGDFGLGTFENLNGEMVILDGHVYQVRGDGKVSEAPACEAAPLYKGSSR